MSKNPLRLAFCLTGSFCTFSAAFRQMERCVSLGYEVLPVFSYHAAELNTRFGKASDHLVRARAISGHEPILTIPDAEPIGPKNMADILLVCPCTGNTMAKLAGSVTDTPVTMAVKSHLRQGRPVVLCPATNDALKGSAKNIGALLNTGNYYFVPFSQDNPTAKPASLVADFDLVPEALEAALEGRQLQPILR
jgi:dipicolinate synthase subunit B